MLDECAYCGDTIEVGEGVTRLNSIFCCEACADLAEEDAREEENSGGEGA